MTAKHHKRPEWASVKLHFNNEFRKTNSVVLHSGVATVCEEAHCPNIAECWGYGTATFMIMGDTCTRGCRFCAVKTSKNPRPLDPNEPLKLAQSIKKLDLQYIVITSVDRDDLPDGGAKHFAQTIMTLKQYNPQLKIEVLTPDFQGNEQAIQTVIDAKPDVFAHNIETVKRLTPKVRDRRASYEQSLFVLEKIKELQPTMITKSSIMLGLGENKEEVIETMKDLRSRDVSILTIGQYLQPTVKHLKVERYVTPKEFRELKEIGLKLGFEFIASGPLVRSSYKAAEAYKIIQKKINRGEN